MSRVWVRVLVAAAVASATSPALATNGHVLHGVGAVNQALGGAGIATSLDAIGSNGNNVSSIAFLEHSSAELGAELFFPDRSMYSSIGGLAAGTVDSKTREAVIPSFGLAYKGDEPWTFAFSGVGISGFGVDYPAESANPSGDFNPLALPQPFGLGAIYSNYQLMQLTPSVAYRILPNLSVGAGVNIDWASLSAAPWPATKPNASGYPTATHTGTAWGGGFTVGATYKPLENLALGLSFKSPQWFGSFDWHSQYPDGTPTSFSFRLDYPMIIGAGVSYRPTERWLLASDVRWINYSDTEGFDEDSFKATPSGPVVRGFGWDNIWVLALGVQYKVVPRVPLRLGYNVCENPISSGQQFFNMSAPGIVQHHLTAGFGVSITARLDLNVAYYHAFDKTKSGPIVSDGRPNFPPLNQAIPGTKVENTLSEDSVSMQLALKF